MSTVEVSELVMNGQVLPYVEIQYANNQQVESPGRKIKGIATITDDNGFISITAANRGPAKGIRFSPNGSASDNSYGWSCAKQ